MSTEASIRPATTHDLDAMTALLSELNREEGYVTSASIEQLRAALIDGRVRMRAMVAEEGRAITGLLLYYWGYDTVSATYGYHLADIVVTKGKRGRGTGKRLFKALAAQCLGEGGEWVSLTVLKKNEAAHKFYAGCGMTEVAVNFFAIGPQALSRCAQR